MDEQYHGSENRLGGQNLENPQSSSHTSPSSAHTSHATVQSSRSGLTQNVSGDNRSHQSSAPAGGGGEPAIFSWFFTCLDPQRQIQIVTTSEVGFKKTKQKKTNSLNVLSCLAK